MTKSSATFDDWLALYMHQNDLLWSIEKRTFVIESAILIGWFTVNSSINLNPHHVYGTYVLGTGIFFLAINSALLFRAGQFLKFYGDHLGSTHAAVSKSFFGLTGRRVAWVTPILLILFNIAILVIAR
jgi:hypothetical protein